MQRSWIGIAALLGFCGVGAGAVGAHAVADPLRAALLVTATNFALPHAAALIGLSAMTGRSNGRAGRWLVVAAGWGMAVGALLFSGALWIHGLFGVSLGPVAPTGGTLLMLSWLVLLPAALLASRSRSITPDAG